MIKEYDSGTHELRRKATRREYSDAEGAVYYHPHLKMKASEYARTKRAYDKIARKIEAKTGLRIEVDSFIYVRYILPLIEDVAKNVKFNCTGTVIRLGGDVIRTAPTRNVLAYRNRKAKN